MPASAAALRAAIHGALKNDGPLAAMLGGGKIYDEPPREAALPYVTLGKAVVSDRSTSTEAGDEHALTLHVWSRQGGHREAHLISGALLQALVDAPLSPEGQHLGEANKTASEQEVGHLRSELDHALEALKKQRAMAEIAVKLATRADVLARLEEGSI
jgi:hypothetical protein